jgi:MFS family permease
MNRRDATGAPANNDHLIGIAFGLGLAFLAAYQQFKLPVVLPVLLADYSYDRTLAGGFMSIYGFFGLFLSIPLGRAIERHGAASLIAWALLLMVLGNGIGLFRPESGWLMLTSRGLEGIAFAVLAIGGAALANANASPRSLPLVAGATWIPVGQLSATVLAPIAIATSSWRMLWYVGIGATVLFFLWTIINRISGSVVLTPPASVATDKSGASTDITPRERRGLILRGLILTALLFMLWSGQYFAYMTWLPQYLVEVHGLAITQAQWGYAIPVSLVMVVCVVTGLLLQRGLFLGTLLVSALITQAAVWWLLPFTGGGISIRSRGRGGARMLVRLTECYSATRTQYGAGLRHRHDRSQHGRTHRPGAGGTSLQDDRQLGPGGTDIRHGHQSMSGHGYSVGEATAPINRSLHIDADQPPHSSHHLRRRRHPYPSRRTRG